MPVFRLRLCLLFFILCTGAPFGFASGNFNLAQDGKSEVSILIDSAVSAMVRADVDTLRRYIREISGAELPIVHSAPGKGQQIVVEIGKSRDPNLHTADLGNDGFRIKTVGGDLCITADSDCGFQNAVYTFLESYLGCRKYSLTVQVIPKRGSISLSDIDDTQIPPLTFRMQDFHDSSYLAWHKLNTHDDFGLFVHTFMTLVPPEKYFEPHPEYYSMSKGIRTPNGQLCLSNPDVFRIVVDELRVRMKANPGAHFWSVSQNDTYIPCECDACRAIDSVEGSPSGSIIAFVDRIADEFPDRTISTLAYEYSRSAPKHIKPRPNVNIMLCSIECNRSQPLADDPGNASFVKDVRDWAGLTDNIFLWDYVIQFRNLMSPFPNLWVLQPNVQFFVQNGVKSVFEQGLADMHGEFAELRAYLISKLLWNPYINVDSVTNDFLQGFYGNAAPFIRHYIDTMHTALQKSGEDLSVYGYPTTSKEGYLSLDMMDVYGAIFDRAEEATVWNPELLLRVQTARLPLQYALLEQAKVNGTAEQGCFIKGEDGALNIRPELDSLLTIFVRRCKQAGVPKLWEHGTTPDEYFASTRSFLERSIKNHLARGKSVTIVRPASPKYHNGEVAALTDGLRGWEDYHMHWLGFEGEDMEATIDLDSVQTVSAVETDFLQDINSWVFMPLAVECAISEDGLSFRTIGAAKNMIATNREGAVVAPFNISCEPVKARYIRVKAVNMKNCPVWHKGSGGMAWIFIDEIAVR